MGGTTEYSPCFDLVNPPLEILHYPLRTDGTEFQRRLNPISGKFFFFFEIS